MGLPTTATEARGIKRKRHEGQHKQHVKPQTSDSTTSSPDTTKSRPDTTTSAKQHSSPDDHATACISSSTTPRPSQQKQDAERRHRPVKNATVNGPQARRVADLLASRAALPITAHKSAIISALRESPVLLLTGATGSGKSTQLPQYLLDAPWRKARIAVTQPRRVAAINLARRVADELGTPLGRAGPAARVGYNVRFDDNVGKNNEVKFLTEGMLLQEMLRDPSLKEYDVVVVDEVHERSVNVDLILGFLWNLVLGTGELASRRNGRKLRVVVMSATANTETLSAFFEEGSAVEKSNQSQNSRQVNTVAVEGRQHPVQITYLPHPTNDFLEAALKCIFQVHCKEAMPGDVLVFLTGQETIQSLQKNVEEVAQNLTAEYPKVY